VKRCLRQEDYEALTESDPLHNDGRSNSQNQFANEFPKLKEKNENTPTKNANSYTVEE